MSDKGQGKVKDKTLEVVVARTVPYFLITQLRNSFW